MCGITGFVTGAKNRKRIYRVYKEMLALSVRRGYDATGVAVTLEDGKMGVAKGAVPAPRFVEGTAYQEVMGRQPVAVIGHVRAATKGSPSVNKNNHPIVASNIVGVHNGVIRNDEYLTKHYALKRKAVVDSEVVFAAPGQTGQARPAGYRTGAGPFGWLLCPGIPECQGTE